MGIELYYDDKVPGNNFWVAFCPQEPNLWVRAESQDDASVQLSKMIEDYSAHQLFMDEKLYDTEF